MTALPYPLAILRLAAASGDHPALANAGATATRDSQTCGSDITVTLDIEAGRIARFGHRVRACAIGQAAATVLAERAVGLDVDAVTAARTALADILAGRSDTAPGDWPDLDHFRGVREFKARHEAALLPFDATLAALRGDVAT
ncbi:MAG: iron-sulfur cluster assembly scaffold protein [Azospirillaceae bacterium]